MIFDREENETLRIDLEQWLVSFFRLDCWSNRHRQRFLLGNFDYGLGRFNFDDGYLGVKGQVFLIRLVEVKLLRRRVGHLEGLNGRRSLCKSRVSMYFSRVERRGKDVIPSLMV